jgi:hypothetical protein
MSDPHGRVIPIDKETKERRKKMTTLSLPISIFDNIDRMVCVFCDVEVTEPYCSQCMNYKGLMTIVEWEDYTGEVWVD